MPVMPLCKNCSRRKAVKKNLCRTCLNPKFGSKPKKCSNCKSQDVVSKGRCSACYQYRRLHGTERITKKNRAGLKVCSNCKKNPAISKGRCSACYQYHRLHGTERIIKKNRAGPKVCSNCKKNPAISKGRCSACYQYYRNHKKDMDRGQLRARLARGSKCSNCKSKKVAAKGRCSTCYAYHKRNGKDRDPNARKHTGRNKKCTVCGRPGTVSKERCTSCYRYYNTYKKDRDQEGVRRLLQRGSRPVHKKCSVCGRDGVKSKGRCASCYQYYNKHGRDRSKEQVQILRSRSEKLPCSNCKKKLAASKGRCPTCYQYYRNHGRERDPSGRTPKSERRKKERCINGCSGEPVLWAEKLWQEPYYGTRPPLTSVISGKDVPVESGWLCMIHHARWKQFPCLRRPPRDGKGEKIRAYPRGPWICKGRKFSNPGSCHGTPLRLERIDATGEVDYGKMPAGSMNLYLDGMCPGCRFADQQVILGVATRHDPSYPEPKEMDAATDMMLANMQRNGGVYDPSEFEVARGVPEYAKKSDDDAATNAEIDPMSGDPVGWSPKLEDLE